MQHLLKVTVLSALLVGCTSNSGEPAKSEGAETSQNSAYQSCPARRPEICTQEYLPVCGITDEKVRRTYGNACTACGDAQVHGYVPGECD